MTTTRTDRLVKVSEQLERMIRVLTRMWERHVKNDKTRIAREHSPGTVQQGHPIAGKISHETVENSHAKDVLVGG